ncbi:MAG: phosphoglucosamine mutase [Candidatus Methylomirabilis oxygeniifera]|uniref:Phosphoglucosamine mutase n=1 Tax=Methylomirabilis oxygeniifera TaxID=671143 RepID=D5MFT9_METO1|nr:MAG: phosphoglucosamine mutase [Candidatus Methylomirabilis oxyfera]CBE68620.1 phosphoglucosamine mutase [Candidatus Methylomirabilis oxyfera]
MRQLFGTDGIRGVANREPMTPETMVKVGRAAAHLLRGATERPTIVIGKDTRLTGYMLETALTAGITSMGVDVLLVGPLPTPGIAFITRSLRADAGVVISASHNPYEDNGIKFFSHEGLKLPDAMEQRIEELIRNGEIDGIRTAPSEIGKAYRVGDAVGRYIEFAKNTLPKGMTLKGMRVVVDCANGAAYKVSPAVLKELNAEVVSLNVEPDGTNINKGCGSLHPEEVRRAVVKHKAHVGFAHDGDADRVVFVDERGELMDGDHILALCALDLKREGRLRENTIVATVMSNIGLDLAMQEAGIKIVRTAVGDRYVLEKMLAERYMLGGEQSGHIIFLEHHTTGDGLVTALQVLATMQRCGKPLSELKACMTSYPQVLINAPVRRRAVVEELPRVQEAIRSAETSMGGRGRILVRLSGTEPVARIMVEGEESAKIERLAREIALAIEKELG